MKALFAIVTAVMLVTAAQAAAFGSASSFAPNPIVGTGDFDFDLEMRIDVKATGIDGKMTLYVNSADGSMALENPHTTAWAFGMPDLPDMQIHQVVWRSGEFLVCGIHHEAGKGCLTFGSELSPLWTGIRAARITEDAAAFFATVPETGQDAVPCCQPGSGGLAHMAGRGWTGERIVFWFDPGSATTRITPPFVGPGVGIMKDRISRTTRVVRHFFVDPPDGQSPVGAIILHLDRLTTARHGFDLTDYPLVTAFSAPAIGEAGLLSDWMRQQGAEIQHLTRQMESECDAGAAGNDCRKAYRARIKAVEELIKSKVFAFGSKFGLPGLGD